MRPVLSVCACATVVGTPDKPEAGPWDLEVNFIRRDSFMYLFIAILYFASGGFLAFSVVGIAADDPWYVLYSAFFCFIATMAVGCFYLRELIVAQTKKAQPRSIAARQPSTPKTLPRAPMRMRNRRAVAAEPPTTPIQPRLRLPGPTRRAPEPAHRPDPRRNYQFCVACNQPWPCVVRLRAQPVIRRPLPAQRFGSAPAPGSSTLRFDPRAVFDDENTPETRGGL